MSVILHPPRFSAVLWLSTLEDLDEGRANVWSIDQHGQDHESGWLVTVPSRDPEDWVLVLHATRGNGNDGGVIALSIRERGFVRATRQIVHEPAWQRNPNRAGDPGDDGA